MANELDDEKLINQLIVDQLKMAKYANLVEKIGYNPAPKEIIE